MPPLSSRDELLQHCATDSSLYREYNISDSRFIDEKCISLCLLIDWAFAGHQLFNYRQIPEREQASTMFNSDSLVPKLLFLQIIFPSHGR